jgi:DNA-binding response OmpR family regulator
VVVRGNPVELTPTEFEILSCLMRHRDRVLSCREIVNYMHGHQLDERDARLMLRSHVHRLRQKIEEEPSQPRLICTMRGSGYTFAAV